MAPDAARFGGCARGDAGFRDPPLAVWQAVGSTKEDRALSLAGGVAAMLADPDAWRIRSPAGGASRGVGPSDVALLCRHDEDIENVAGALAGLGLPVSVRRGDHFANPEVEFPMAALH